MKRGDEFYCPGNWNTDPGWWEITVPDAGCGMTRARPVGSVGGESEWFTQYVEHRMADTQIQRGNDNDHQHP